MELPILDQNNHEEQPYYPPPNYECIPENNRVQEDDYFVDETVVSPTDDKKNKYFRGKITRKSVYSYIIREMIVIKYIIIASFVCAIIFPALFFITQTIDLYNIIMTIILFLVICSSPLFIGCKIFHLVYLDLLTNSIILTKKAMFNKKVIVYNMGELEKAEICYKYNSNTEGNHHIFKLYFVRKTGEKEEFHSLGVPNLDVNLKGIIFFIDLVNWHIRKFMN